jgi:hypothetical protein
MTELKSSQLFIMVYEKKFLKWSKRTDSDIIVRITKTCWVYK